MNVIRNGILIEFVCEQVNFVIAACEVIDQLQDHPLHAAATMTRGERDRNLHRTFPRISVLCDRRDMDAPLLCHIMWASAASACFACWFRART